MVKEQEKDSKREEERGTERDKKKVRKMRKWERKNASS